MTDRPAAQKRCTKCHARGKRPDHGGAEGERGQDFVLCGPECLQNRAFIGALGRAGRGGRNQDQKSGDERGKRADRSG